MTKQLTSLELIEAAIWRELASAIGSPDHAWRTATLASVAGCSAAVLGASAAGSGWCASPSFASLSANSATRASSAATLLVC